jgi:hypothetical protein
MRHPFLVNNPNGYFFPQRQYKQLSGEKFLCEDYLEYSVYATTLPQLFNEQYERTAFTLQPIITSEKASYSHVSCIAKTITTPMAIATEVNAASIPRDTPLRKSPAIISLMALVIATPGTSGINPPTIIISRLTDGQTE